MKVYYTKYALTKGVMVVEGEPSELADRTGYFLPASRHWGYMFPAWEWFETWEEAMSHVEALRDKAVVSAEKKLAKLKAMKWEKPE